MNLPLPIREALENLRASWLFCILLAAVAATSGAAVSITSVVESTKYSAQWADAVATGQFVMVASATSASGLAASRCESINTFAGVEAAGAVLERRDIQLSSTGAERWTEMTVTPHFVHAAWSTAPSLAETPTVFSGNEFADMLGLAPGAILEIRGAGDRKHEVLALDWTAQERSRIEGVNRTLLRVGYAAGTVERCYVAAMPAAFADVGLAVRDWFPDPVEVSELIVPSSAPSVALTPNRLAGWGWLLSAIVNALLISTWWFTRRADFALYRVLKMRLAAFVAMVITEVSALLIVPSAIGATVAICVLHPNNDFVLAALAVDSLRFTIALVPLPLIAIVIGRRKNALRSLSGF